jgi:hypothetical protein
MTRGIHLKQLSDTDLTALGLEERRLSEAAPTMLDETDPALSRLVGEVREGLEGTLELLEQALAAQAEG